MDNRKTIRNLLIGKTNYLESKFDYKSAMLRDYMAIIALSVGFSYTIIDRINNIYTNIPYYVVVQEFMNGELKIELFSSVSPGRNCWGSVKKS